MIKILISSIELLKSIDPYANFQASLINVCRRGCDLFTVALISCDEPPKDKLKPVEKLLEKNSLKVVRLLGKELGTKKSSTTVEPTSQPVQEHPVEAGKESTTTNGPKKILLKKTSDEKKMTTTTLSDMKGKLEQAKHSCRHGKFKRDIKNSKTISS